ncbi:MAG TPA: P1 family peptidase [Clostridia bacterium]|nr:P1 family peptidase [Clostridia bacterium]
MLDKFKIGHECDSINKTGVTVILANGGAVAGVSVRGSAPATRETDLLKPEKMLKKIDAVVLSGGSSFGLESCAGVMDFLFEQNIGYDAGEYKVPIVSGACLYDLEAGRFAYPDKSMGYLAAQKAKTNNFEIGRIGAGTGATVGKILGMKSAQPGGLGVAVAKSGKVEVGVVIAVNPLGDVVKDGKIIAGARLGNDFLNTTQYLLNENKVQINPQNTMIGCVITNAILNKSEANQLADIAHDGIAKTIEPSHTLYDGDAMFAMASCDQKVDFITMCALVPYLTKKAILSVFDNIEEEEE